MNKIEVNLSQGKINFINDTYQKELQYWEKAALKKVLDENEAKEFTDLAPSRVFLIRQDAIKNAKKMNIHEIMFYLKSQYSADNRNQITFIQAITSQGDVPSFESISEELKDLSKSIKENENTSLKNKFLFGGCISIAAKAYKHDKIRKKKNLPHPFEDWIYRECGIKKQTIYNYKNLYKLMSIASKLFNCRVNMTYFVKNYEIIMGYFEENEEQIPWRHHFNCECEDCSFYFFEE